MLASTGGPPGDAGRADAGRVYRTGPPEPAPACPDAPALSGYGRRPPGRSPPSWWAGPTAPPSRRSLAAAGVGPLVLAHDGMGGGQVLAHPGRLPAALEPHQDHELLPRAGAGEGVQDGVLLQAVCRSGPTSASSSSAGPGAGCSTSARTRPAMNRAVRTGVPPRVLSVTSTSPRPWVTSTRRPARVASIS